VEQKEEAPVEQKEAPVELKEEAPVEQKAPVEQEEAPVEQKEEASAGENPEAHLSDEATTVTASPSCDAGDNAPIADTVPPPEKITRTLSELAPLRAAKEVDAFVPGEPAVPVPAETVVEAPEETVAQPATQQLSPSLQLSSEAPSAASARQDRQAAPQPETVPQPLELDRPALAQPWAPNTEERPAEGRAKSVSMCTTVDERNTPSRQTDEGRATPGTPSPPALGLPSPCVVEPAPAVVGCSPELSAVLLRARAVRSRLFAGGGTVETVSGVRERVVQKAASPVSQAWHAEGRPHATGWRSQRAAASKAVESHCGPSTLTERKRQSDVLSISGDVTQVLRRARVARENAQSAGRNVVVHAVKGEESLVEALERAKAVRTQWLTGQSSPSRPLTATTAATTASASPDFHRLLRRAHRARIQLAPP